ncbi:hypothetical protein FF1_034777 [Malus domestica]
MGVFTRGSSSVLWNKLNASIKRRNRRGAPQRSVLSQIEESGFLSQKPDSFLKRGVSVLKSRILFSKEAFHFLKAGLAQKPRAEPRISKDQLSRRVVTCHTQIALRKSRAVCRSTNSEIEEGNSTVKDTLAFSKAGLQPTGKSSFPDLSARVTCYLYNRRCSELEAPIPDINEESALRKLRAALSESA